jgi:hypothetical protein
MEITYTQDQSLSVSQREDIRLASSKLHGIERRAFQAEMALKHCQGNARLSENVFGWGRNSVATGLGEKRTGIICVGAQSGFGGNKRWEARYPDAAAVVQELAEEHSQQDPTFKSSIAYTRLSAAEALRQLEIKGFAPDQIPSPSAMAEILNRMGYRLRKVVKAKPKKRLRKQTRSLRTSKPKTAKGKSGSSV